VRHILLKTDGKPGVGRSKIKAKAKIWLKQIRGGRISPRWRRRTPRTPGRPPMGRVSGLGDARPPCRSFEKAWVSLKPGQTRTW